MLKIILFDADGVALKSQRYFTEVSSEKYNLPLDKISPFFRGPFQECQKGKADLKKEIVPYLNDWGWPGTVHDYLKEWFATDVQKDEQVLEYIQTLRKSGVQCFLATDQEKYRSEYITNELAFGNYFDGLFYSCDLGHTKSEPEFFEFIIKKLNVRPEDVMYWDDDKKNVAVARSLGIQGNVYSSFEQLENALK